MNEPLTIQYTGTPKTLFGPDNRLKSRENLALNRLHTGNYQERKNKAQKSLDEYEQRKGGSQFSPPVTRTTKTLRGIAGYYTSPSTKTKGKATQSNDPFSPMSHNLAVPREKRSTYPGSSAQAVAFDFSDSDSDDDVPLAPQLNNARRPVTTYATFTPKKGEAQRLGYFSPPNTRSKLR